MTISVADANEDDVMFTQMMIPHHEQAVVIADLATERSSDPFIQALASEIASAQDPEIALMDAWLEEWNIPRLSISDLLEGHATHGMDGMLTDRQMRKLEKADGPAFDALFAKLMIDHHEGAVAMARDVLYAGSSGAVSVLAQEIIVTQETEIM